MPHVMLRWQYTTQSAKGLVKTLQDRAAAAARLAEDFGGKLRLASTPGGH